MKLIIAGDRRLHGDGRKLDRFIKELPGEVVSGFAPGVDRMAEDWALHGAIPLKLFPAEWDAYGKAAGPRRNQEMAEYADALLAIWDGESRGTGDMIRRMKRLGKPVRVIRLVWHEPVLGRGVAENKVAAIERVLEGAADRLRGIHERGSELFRNLGKEN